MVAGVQVPVIPLGAVVAKGSATVPLQSVCVVAKSGIINGLLITVSSVVVAHCPLSGVKVYVPLLVVSIVSGFHVPVMPLGEVVSKTGAGVPLHMVSVGLKSGITGAVTVTCKVTADAHWDALVSGVKM